MGRHSVDFRQYGSRWISWLLISLVGASLAAQRGAGSDRPKYPEPVDADEALAWFERDRDNTRRWKYRIRDLGKFDDDRVRALLLAELRSTEDWRRQVEVANALGARRRAGIEPVLEQLLLVDPGGRRLRRASAKGLGLQGANGVERLLAILRDVASNRQLARAKQAKDGESATERLRDLRLACIDGLRLACTESAAARDALVALVDSADAAADRLRALQALADIQADKGTTQVRTAALRDKDLEVATEAAKQLAQSETANAAEAVLRVHRRVQGDKRASGDARAAVVEAMLSLLDSEAMFAPFLRAASASDADVAARVERFAARIGEYPEFRRYLLREGLASKRELERCLAIRLLTTAEGAECTDALAEQVKAREPAVVHVAIRALGDRGDLSVVPLLRKLLAATNDARRVASLLALHALLGAQDEWAEELLRLADSRDRELRATSFDLLADLGSEAGLVLAWGGLDDSAWQVRAAAYDYCRAVRSLDSIDRLIRRVDAEDGRLREDVLGTLQSLTARRYPTTSSWQKWWQGRKQDFELPPEPDGDGSKGSRRTAPNPKTVTYYSIPLISKRVAFVVDTSGSMRDPLREQSPDGERRTRLEEAKYQLGRVVEGMSDDTEFNLVFFDHAANRVFKLLAPAHSKSRKKALAAVQKARARGGTDVHEAMQTAFEEVDVDTIYLLSDGYPSAGDIQDASALADEIARWNRTRQIRIHCIALGSNSGMLRRIAAESGGKYAHVR